MEIASKLVSDHNVEQSLVQILVVVAITQMRILRTEEGKGSVITVVGYGLVDPKVQVNSTCIVTFYFGKLVQTERESG